MFGADTNVLVIDDDPIIGRLLSTVLQREGYQVRVAESVGGGLELIDSERPDVILCDLVLPIVSGLDFLRERQSSPKLANIPVVIISASSEEVMIEEALSLGAEETLRKPFGRIDLLGVVTSAVGKTQEHG